MLVSGVHCLFHHLSLPLTFANHHCCSLSANHCCRSLPEARIVACLPPLVCREIEDHMKGMNRSLKSASCFTNCLLHFRDLLQNWEICGEGDQWSEVSVCSTNPYRVHGEDDEQWSEVDTRNADFSMDTGREDRYLKLAFGMLTSPNIWNRHFQCWL